MSIQETVGVKGSADFSQARAEVQGFKAAIDAVGQASTKMGVSVRDAVDWAGEALGKFNLAIGGVEKAFGLLKSGMAAAEEINQLERLERSLPIGAVDRLAAASEGLVSRQQTLRVSVRGMTGDFKLTEDQMGRVLHAAEAMAVRGFGTADEMATKLLESTVKFEQEGLAQLGIQFVKTGDRIADVNTLLGKYDEIVAETGPTDERTRHLAELNRAMEDLARWIKEVVAAAVNGIADMMHTGREGWNYLKNNWENAGEYTSFEVTARRKERLLHPTENGQDPAFTMAMQDANNIGTRYQQKAEFDARAKEARRLRERTTYDPGDWAGYTDEEYAAQFGLQGAPGNLVDRYGTIGHAYKAGPDRAYSIPGGDVGEHTSYGRDNVASLALRTSAAADAGGFGLQGGLRGSGFAARPGMDTSEQGSYSYSGVNDNGDDSVQAALKNTSSAAGAAYASLSAGMAAAVDAAISGNESIGRAAAKGSAAVLKALAIEAIGKAGWYAAEALGYAISGNAAKATAALAAAGTYAAKAAALGGLAAGLGALAGGGGGSSGDTSGASSTAGGGFARPSSAGGQGGGETIVINIHSPVMGTPAQVAQQVHGAVRQAKRQGAREDYTTYIEGA